MRMYDIIKRKRDGFELTPQEINFFVAGYVSGTIPDYQASALAMAIFFKGMTARETGWLTWEMACSGEMIDLSSLSGIKVDKHSTGGVGDKTTLAVAPIVAATGVPVAKMSGRGLGHTGGTLDKLESIPGFSVEIEHDRFLDIVRKTGVAVIGQTANLVPADKKLYALRDVTATVDSIPLIASSIMSKKIAAGANCILLDVKCGSGAFMKTFEDAEALAKAMVDIGEQVKRTTVALITNMDQPLGNTIGNSLEVREAIDVLKGCAPEDITETCLELAANMLFLAHKGTLISCRDLARRQVESGAALRKFREMVAAQGGDERVADDYGVFEPAKYQRELKAPVNGWVQSMDAERCGLASAALGAGRATKDDTVDLSAGIVLNRKTGDRVNRGDVLATLYSSTKEKLNDGERMLLSAYGFGDSHPARTPHFLARVTSEGVERLV